MGGDNARDRICCGLRVKGLRIKIDGPLAQEHDNAETNEDDQAPLDGRIETETK
jgi:hypothetical protein